MPVRHDTTHDLGAASDVVGLCVATDDDVMQVVTGGLLDALRPGSVVVNHGTGTPANAVRLTETCAAALAELPLAIEFRIAVADIEADLTGYRPSYRCLAWYLRRRGLPPRPDLLGDDQPEAVARQYEAEAAWLTGSDQPQKPPGSGLMPPS